MKNQTNRNKNNGTNTRIHMYTQTKPKYSKKIMDKRVTWWKKETKYDINQLKTKLTKTKDRKQTKAKCQLRNEAKKTRKTNRNGKKNRKAKLKSSK